MDRKHFIKKSLIAGLAGSILPVAAKANIASKERSTYDKLMNQVGFNHMPNEKEVKTMNTCLLYTSDAADDLTRLHSISRRTS